MIISIKRTANIMIAITLTLTFLLLTDNNISTVGSFNSRIIVIDAGHGAPDGGAVGESGILESDINLKVARYLEDILTKKGYTVIMTRKDENGLFSAESQTVRNKKREDMKKRVDIANTNNASLLISIHMNYYGLESCSGPQVFYFSESQPSKEVATNIRESFIENIGEHCIRETKPVTSGMYLLCHAKIPAVLVECGFLSNNAEEKLLLNDGYQKKIAESIANGVIKVFPKMPL